MSKYEIIYTDDYALIVSDSEPINMGDSIYDIVSKEVHEANDEWHNDTHPEWAKVIAHRPLTDAPILKDVPLLPEFTQEEDVSELSLKTYPFGNPERNAFITGYNKAKETYKYTEEDLRKAYFKGATDVHDKCTVRTWRGVEVNVDLEKLKECNKQFTQSLQQPKRPKYFEYETIYRVKSGTIQEHKDGLAGFEYHEPKTIINAQGQTELIGDYIYEKDFTPNEEIFSQFKK
jgi:hypothetical protein